MKLNAFLLVLAVAFGFGGLVHAQYPRTYACYTYYYGCSDQVCVSTTGDCGDGAGPFNRASAQSLSHK